MIETQQRKTVTGKTPNSHELKIRPLSVHEILAIKQRYKITDYISGLVPIRETGWYNGPCPMCGGDDRFNVKPDSDDSRIQVWLCRKCGDGKYHDILDLAQRLNGYCALRVAADKITGGKVDLSVAGAVLSKPRQKRKVAEIPPEQWQAQAYDLWLNAHQYFLDRLASGTHDKALSWLMSRGIMPKQIREYGLGFHEGGNGLARGIVIPGFYKGDITYLKVRTNGVNQPKYSQLKGGKSSSLFNADRLAGKRNIIVVEGEFDAMILEKFVSDDTAVCTMGGASQIPKFSAWGHLFSLANLYVFQDGDIAGELSAEKWKEAYPYATMLPSLGKRLDITDYWKLNGGDGLKSWLDKNIA